MRVLWVLVLVLVGAVAYAATLTESKIVCDQELRAVLEPDGVTPHVYAECATFDAAGQPIRPVRQIDVTGKLTTQQRNGVIAILQQLQNFAAQAVTIPTPTP